MIQQNIKKDIYINKKIKKIKEIDNMYYLSDRLICEVIEELFDCRYYYDLNGTLRITNGKYTNKEKEFNKDLNKGWQMHYDGKYTFAEVVKAYTKMDYSVGGFMEIFSHRLISENIEEMSEEEIKIDIKKIIKSEKSCYE